jgi:hypothetical protein
VLRCWFTSVDTPNKNFVIPWRTLHKFLVFGFLFKSKSLGARGKYLREKFTFAPLDVRKKRKRRRMAGQIVYKATIAAGTYTNKQTFALTSTDFFKDETLFIAPFNLAGNGILEVANLSACSLLVTIFPILNSSDNASLVYHSSSEIPLLLTKPPTSIANNAVFTLLLAPQEIVNLGFASSDATSTNLFANSQIGFAYTVATSAPGSLEAFRQFLSSFGLVLESFSALLGTLQVCHGAFKQYRGREFL